MDIPRRELSLAGHTGTYHLQNLLFYIHHFASCAVLVAASSVMVSTTHQVLPTIISVRMPRDVSRPFHSPVTFLSNSLATRTAVLVSGIRSLRLSNYPELPESCALRPLMPHEALFQIVELTPI